MIEELCWLFPVVNVALVVALLAVLYQRENWLFGDDDVDATEGTTERKQRWRKRDRQSI